MNEYNYVPRPHVEEHHHIRDLIESQEKRVEDREYHRNRLKALEERNDLIKDAKPFTLTDFWCDQCREDFKAQAVKQIESDWSCDAQNIAFYKTKCFKGHWCMRLITDRHTDPFWFRSKLVALDRGNHSLDTIQPWETNFNLLYGKK